MSDKLYTSIIYAIVFGSTMYLCGNFLDAIKANSASQKRAAWAQVYWVRRRHLMDEKDWQEKWEALHSEEYCRQLSKGAP